MLIYKPLKVFFPILVHVLVFYVCFLKVKKADDNSLSFFIVLISKFGASRWKIEAPQTISLALGASIGGNTVYHFISFYILVPFMALYLTGKWNGKAKTFVDYFDLSNNLCSLKNGISIQSDKTALQAKVKTKLDVKNIAVLKSLNMMFCWTLLNSVICTNGWNRKPA